MQRTFFIFFILLTSVNSSFWTFEFQDESEAYHLFGSKKELVDNSSKLIFQEEQLNICSEHAISFQDNASLTNVPVEHEDEDKGKDKDEAENETLIGASLYSLNTPVANALYLKNSFFCYDRSFFKIHFLDIFSPPPNC